MQLGVLFGLLMLLCSCSSKKYLAEGQYLLSNTSLLCDSTTINTSSLSGYIRQQPNSRWLSIAKLPLGVYLLSNPHSNSGFNKFLRKMGQAPVVYDSTLTRRSSKLIKDAVFNLGYLHVRVDVDEHFKDHKVRVDYKIIPGARYYVDSIEVHTQDTLLAREIDKISHATLLRKGMPFDANILNRERTRITDYLNDNGYYSFNQEFIRYEVDTASSSLQVRLRMYVMNNTTPTNPIPQPHHIYKLGKVNFSYDSSANSPIRFKPSLFKHNHSLYTGDVYRESNVSDTYSRLNRLPAVASTNIHFNHNSQDSTLLDADIIITPARLNSIQLGLDGTNTAGDLGAAATLTFQNRNVFHGSEVFSLNFRTAFEAIRGLSGYADQNYFEYGVEAGLTFPDFLFPFLSFDIRHRSRAHSELNAAFASQNRPEFHRRVLTASWRYRWVGRTPKHYHKFDLLDINYVYMPWISQTFYDTYIKNPESRNAIIAYNYKNLFIVKLGYQYQYSSIGTASPIGIYGKNAYNIRLAAETAGNLVDGLCNLFNTRINDDGQRTLFNIAYAHYAKVDFDYSQSISLSNRSSLAFHFAFGVAYPYGNSSILPYEKRYFGGGANSIRGWSVRSLGPGSFIGNDGKIDFINQTGDVKLDLSVEFRTHLFWKFDGALFVDAGNIWTLRDYPEQPGGQFRFDTCWEQIAASYGLGLRLNLDYFLLRLDAGMKAINPAYQDVRHHYPIIYPNFKRDFALHFAVGLPF